MSCKCEHTITRDGTGQLDRYLKALDPEYAPIDGRDIKELLVYAKRYAGQIRFYDLPEHLISDGVPANKVSWREFFSKDVSVIAASIGTIDLAQIKKDYDETRMNVESDPNATLFAALANPIIGIAVRLESWLELVTTTNPIYEDMMLAINSSLRIQLQRLKALDEGYVIVDAGADLEIDYAQIKNFALWGLDKPIDPDLSVYQGVDDESKIRSAALYMDAIFLSFYGYISELVERSEEYLLASLDNYPSHQPHMALFIAFLKLFKIVQEQMNRITEGMLNFYYRDVLRLQEKPSIPDKVHIIFELAKNVSTYAVKKETELDGGKDKAGLDQVYRTDNEIVVNQAKVAELKTLFIEKTVTLNGMPTIKEIYARPVANSVDGYGVPFEDNYPIWPTFGERRKDNTSFKNMCDKIEGLKEEFHFKNEAAIGFALASPQLVLQGGNRLIHLTMNHMNTLVGNKALPESLQIKLTTEDGWLEINDPVILENNIFLQEGDTPRIKGRFEDFDFEGDIPIKPTCFIYENQLFIYLPMGESPVLGYKKDIHEGVFTTTYPIMQVLFGPKVGSNEAIFKLKIRSFSLSVKIGSINTEDGQSNPNMDGLKKLILQNDAGPIDPDKVFDPFTGYPNKGKSLYIGEDEIFNKPLDTLSVNAQFTLGLKVPNTIFTDTAVTHSIASGSSLFRVNVREKRQWTPLNWPDSDGFNSGQLTHNVLFKNGVSVNLDRKPIVTYEEYTGDAIKGFVEIELNQQLFNANTDNPFQVMQSAAELFKIKSLAVSYESTLNKLDPAIDQLFHVYPFGAVEVLIDPVDSNHKEGRRSKNDIQWLKKFNTFDATKDHLLINADNQLLPAFTFSKSYGDLNKKGKDLEINTNFKKVRTSQAQTLLTQVAFNAFGSEKLIGTSRNQYSGEIQEEGLLYIGLENLKSQQTVTLLFQFAEGSAEDTDNDPPEIHWSYLSNNEWKPLNDINIISDGTYGFQTTGIVKIDVPKDATNNNTIITPGLHWFRASVTENSHRVPKLVDVVAQAVMAKFDDRDNDRSHFDCPLPSESISKLLVGKAEVKSVVQPFASWNGKAKEVGKEFYTRVSERLRHKARAINSWDYEHLVLNRFPSIYKVKAITHTDPNCLCRTTIVTKDTNSTTQIKYDANGDIGEVENDKLNILIEQPNSLTLQINAFNAIGNLDLATTVANNIGIRFMEKGFVFAPITESEVEFGDDYIEVKLSGTATTHESCCGPQIAPGHVMLVPISSFKSRNAIDPLRPKTSRRTLLEIEEFLKKRTSPFVRVHAKNPVYEQVMVFFCVKFYSGTDKGFYLKQLNDEIVKHLTPWAYDAGADVQFDQKIYASSIINFIEERPYVDFIKDFFMGVCRDACCSKSMDLGGKKPLVDPEREDVFEPLDSDAVDASIISGQILDAHTEEPLTGAIVVIPGPPPIGTSTDTNGNFLFDMQTNNALVIIQMVGYETKPIMAQANFRWTIYMKKDNIDEVVVVGTRDSENNEESLEEKFDRFCGCLDVEKELTNADFLGETVISPSTRRSILVSAPKHLIIPCDEEIEPDPCAVRRSEQEKSNMMPSRIMEIVEQEKSGPASTTFDTLRFAKKTVKQLKVMAKAAGITGFSSMRKDDLIAVLRSTEVLKSNSSKKK